MRCDAAFRCMELSGHKRRHMALASLRTRARIVVSARTHQKPEPPRWCRHDRVSSRLLAQFGRDVDRRRSDHTTEARCAGRTAGRRHPVHPETAVNCTSYMDASLVASELLSLRRGGFIAPLISGLCTQPALLAMMVSREAGAHLTDGLDRSRPEFRPALPAHGLTATPSSRRLARALVQAVCAIRFLGCLRRGGACRLGVWRLG